MRTIVIFSGGETLPSALAGEIPEDAFVIAADSGLGHALALPVEVDLVVGDLDSVDAGALDRTEAKIERHSPDKDSTDLDLAMEAAMAMDPDRIIVLGGQAGRFDHLLGTVSLLTSSRWVDIDLEWVAATARVRVITGGVTLHGAAGSIVTLLAVNGPATGVVTNGLQWELRGETLEAGSTRGVSNLFTGPVATVRLESGMLLAVQPDPA